MTHSVYGNQLKVMSHVVKEPEDLVSIDGILDREPLKESGRLWRDVLSGSLKKILFVS